MVHSRCHRLFNLLRAISPAACRPESPRDGPHLDRERACCDTDSRTSITRTRARRFYLRRIVPYRADGAHIAAWSSPLPISLRLRERRKRKSRPRPPRTRNSRSECASDRGIGRLSHELALAEVRERQTIARDLHDGLGQELNAASIKLDALRNTEEANRSDAALEKLPNCLKEWCARCAASRPSSIPRYWNSSGSCRRSSVERRDAKDYQLEVVLDDDLQPKPLDAITASILFRAVRELLINVVRMPRSSSSGRHAKR